MDETQAIESQFRSLFAMAMGREVLAHQLDQLGFFLPILDETGVARHNYAIELLRWCKVLLPDEDGTGRVGNMRSLVNALLNVDIEKGV